MLNAVAQAQTKSGQRIAPGGVLEVWIDDYKKSSDPKKEDQKLYAAEYTPPAPSDPLASTSASSAEPASTGAAASDDAPPF
jgi:hypothetical protein